MKLRLSAAAITWITATILLGAAAGTANAQWTDQVSGTATIQITPNQPIFHAKLFVTTHDAESADSMPAALTVGSIPANQTSTFTVPWSFAYFSPTGDPTANLKFVVAGVYGSSDAQTVSITIANGDSLVGASWDEAFFDHGLGDHMIAEIDTANGLRTGVWPMNSNLGNRFEHFDGNPGFGPEMPSLPVGGSIGIGNTVPLVNFSDATIGGTVTAVTTVVPEPAAIAFSGFTFAIALLLERTRRRP